MKIRGIMPTIVEAIELPRIVQLEDNMCAAAFPLMKLLPAHFILNRARDEGALGPNSTIIETTSGTFGLALAMLCALGSYRLILVSDPVIDQPLKERLEDLGTLVEIVQNPAPQGGYQQSRLDRLAELQAQYPDNFWPSQYDNPHNPGAYAPVAELLVEATGQVDCLVGTVGSGGSMCGTSRFLRQLFPRLRTIGVDTHGSVIFGHPDRKRLLRGLGNSLMPRNVDHTAFDEIHWVSAAEAFTATRLLHQNHALFAGGTSGAAYLVARWWARQNRGATVVVLFPDEGYRYQNTIYCDQWLRANGVWGDGLPSEPQLVALPSEVGSSWSRMLWNGRTYAQVMGCPYQAGQVV